MKMIAQTRKGTEFSYNRAQAFRCSDRSANEICKILNSTRWRLRSNDEIWHVYDCSSYELNYTEAGCMKLAIYKGTVKAIRQYA